MNLSHVLKKEIEPQEGIKLTEDAQMVPNRTGSWDHATMVQECSGKALGAPCREGLGI